MLVYNLKVESVLFCEKISGLQAQETASQVALRDCTTEVGEEVKVYMFATKGACSLNIKDYC